MYESNFMNNVFHENSNEILIVNLNHSQWKWDFYWPIDGLNSVTYRNKYVDIVV